MVLIKNIFKKGYGCLFLTLAFLGISFGKLIAQTAPTFIDWVKPSQTYLEINVAKNGVYRLPAMYLNQHFDNLSTLNTNGFQLFRRGKEQAILINAGSDNVLNGNDFIDFVGQINDGSIESEMYQKPAVGINTLRSVYDDT